jgi:hypothetical protein
METKDIAHYGVKDSRVFRVHNLSHPPTGPPPTKGKAVGLFLISKFKSMPHKATNKIKPKVPRLLRVGGFHEGYKNGSMSSTSETGLLIQSPHALVASCQVIRRYAVPVHERLGECAQRRRRLAAVPRLLGGQSQTNLRLNERIRTCFDKTDLF